MSIEIKFPLSSAKQSYSVRRRIYTTNSDPFLKLLAESQVVGTGLPLTWSRTGAFLGPLSGEAVTADNPDQRTVNGLPFYGVYGGATNLVDTDITNWTALQTAVVTNPSPYVYRVTFDGSVSSIVRYRFANASLDRYGKCQMRLVSGSTTSGDSYFSFRDGSSVQRGTKQQLSIVGSDWTDVECSVTSSDATIELVIRGEAAEVFTVEVRYMRATDSTSAYPPFPDGSTAGATYGNDLGYVTPSWGSAATIYIPAATYQWANAANPAGAQAVLFSATNFELNLDASGNIQTASGAATTDKFTANTFQNVWAYADGVNHGVAVDDDAYQTTADSNLPSGNAYLLNKSDGSLPFMGAGAGLLWNRVLSSAERAIVNAGIIARGITGEISWNG